MTSGARTWLAAFRADASGTRFDDFVAGLPTQRFLETAADTASLSLRVVRAAVTRPFGWTREAMVEASMGFRVVFLPMMVAALVYVLAFVSVLFGQIVYTLGAADRISGGLYTGLLRELGTWVTYMVLAATLGSSLAGDLGARRIREELDALDVLGVDRIRMLILPRVVALAFVGLVLSLLVVLVTFSGVILLNTMTAHVPLQTALSSANLQMNLQDLVAAITKHSILGFFIGIVACQKGLSAKGGAEGVGRAVSETVVVTFFGIWLINSLFNTAYLTVVPDALALRG
jgi:phospholipid/cholesterol/gamma-HCH transport system permease protein